jgi:hypothetical protein
MEGLDIQTIIRNTVAEYVRQEGERPQPMPEVESRFRTAPQTWKLPSLLPTASPRTS